MTEKETTPPSKDDSTRTRAATSSPISPVLKRARMASPNTTTKKSQQAGKETPEQAQQAETDIAAEEAEAGLTDGADDFEAVCS